MPENNKYADLHVQAVKINNHIFFILLICGFFFNCSKDKSLNLPPALQKLTEQTECSCNPFIDEYTLDGNTIYIHSCGGPACDCSAIITMRGEKNFYQKVAIMFIM